MALPLKSNVLRNEPGTLRRSPWRQRLVEAERGITQGFRGDSTFFVHFFAVSMILAGALVLGLSLIHWTMLVLALTLVLSAEMFHQALKFLLQSVGPHFEKSAETALRIGTAAVFLAMLGAVIVIGLIFVHRLLQMFGPA